MATVVATVGCTAEPALDVGPGEAWDEEVDGKADAAGETRVELKLTIAPAHIRRARSRLSLLNAASQTRQIWFYDTAALDLLEAGAVLRAREIAGAPDDSTVKLRPLTAAEVDATWFDVAGFKCEIDRLVDRQTSSCSLTIAQDDGEIDDVADGARSIDKLYSADQEELLAVHGPLVTWDELLTLGPIAARVWNLRTDALPAKVTAELWYMPDRTQVLELSMKVPVADGDDALTTLLDWVDERGLDLAIDQETKTRRALELLVAAP